MTVDPKLLKDILKMDAPVRVCVDVKTYLASMPNLKRDNFRSDIDHQVAVQALGRLYTNKGFNQRMSALGVDMLVSGVLGTEILRGDPKAIVMALLDPDVEAATLVC